MPIVTRANRSFAKAENAGQLEYFRGDAFAGGRDDHSLLGRAAFTLRQSTESQAVAGEGSGETQRAPDGGGGIEAFLPSNPQNHTDGGTLELDGASSVASADVGGFTYVFVAGSVDDGISVFRLNANGTLTPVHDVTDAGALELDGARGLSTAMVDGNTYLFVAGLDDNGVSVFRVGTNGSLTSVANVTDDATMLLTGVSDTAAARVGTSTYLFTAGTTENGISIFRVAGDGRLTYLSNQADGGAMELAGVRALSTVTIGATTFLIAGGTDDGISVFSINAATGALTATANINDAAGISLQDVSDITTAVIGGVTYVFIAGAADSGVSVYSLSAAGALTLVDNETDSGATLISLANSVSVHTSGGVSFLLVGGTENGLSIYRIENGSNSGFAAGTLTFLDNIADGGSFELSGTVATGSGNVGGTTYILGAGQTDDGISSFGSTATGQLYYLGHGDPTDARIGYVNNNGSNHTSFVDNGPSVDLITNFPMEIGVDTAAGFYFALSSGNPVLGVGTRLVRGSLSGGAVTTLVTYDGDDNIHANSDDEIINAIHVDVINHRIYVGIQYYDGGTPAQAGIRQYSYNPTTGAISDLGFLVTVASSGKGPESGFNGIFDVRDFDIDSTIVAGGRLFFTELLTGGVQANGLFRLDINSPNTITQMVIQSQFPDAGTNGFIIDVEVDSSTDLVYFSTESQQPFGNAGYNAAHNAIWYVAETATNATATQLILTGLPVGNRFYPGDMVLDQATRQLYIESEEVDDGAGGGDDDVIYVFQLNAAGTSAALINTIAIIPPLQNIAANLGGMIFNNIAVLTGLSGTATPAGEQGAALQLLTAAPTITDSDGTHLSSATVQITGGLFSSNESNATDDRLFFGPTLGASGSVAGTSITWAYNSATNTLTFTGYDTVDNYEIALAGVRFQSLGDNPTNYGLNPTRTITWTASDGALGVPGGSVNSGTTQLTITAVNDGPTNTVPGAQVVNEDSPLNLAISIADPDLNPAITDIVVTLTATNGTLTLLTNVAGGLTAADIAGNGTGSITITATRNEINATLGTVGGLVFLNTPDYNGPASVQIVTNDGGNTGTGGALGDTDTVNITVTPVVDIANDTLNFAEDAGPQSLNPFTNDTFENPGRFVSAVTQGTHGTVTINDNGTAGDATDDFIVYTQIADYNGTDSFTYTVTSGGVTETATVNVTISAVVDIANDASSFAEDSGAQTIDVLANDTFENAARFISSVTQGLHGVVTIVDGPDADGIMDYVVYTQVADYNGTDSFTYTVTSGGVTETATVNLTIGAVQDIADDSVTVNEDSGANALNGIGNPVSLLANDSFENPARFISAVTQGAHGSVAINNNGTAGDTSDDYVVYTVTNPNYNGPDSFTYTVTSGGVTETATVNVTIAAVNDAPVNTVPGAQTINEDGSVTFSGTISIADIDAGGADLTTTLSIADGALTVGAVMAGLTVGGEGTNLLTLTGTLAEINDALNGLTYTPPADANGSRTLTVTTNDNGNTGAPGALQDVDQVTINITAVNDAPVIANLGGDIATYTEEGPAVLLDSGMAATVTDIDNAHFNGGSLAVSITANEVAAEDVLAISTAGTVSLSAGMTNGSIVSVGGLAIGTITSNGAGGADLVIALNTVDATPARVSTLIQALTYANTNTVNPSTMARTLSVTLNDGAGGSDSESVSVNVVDIAENAAPTLDLDADDSNTVGTGYTASFTEGGAAVLITDTDVAITDADVGDMIEGATIAINGPVAGDQLVLGAQGGFVVSGSGTGTITITGTGTAAQYEAMLELITFTNTSDDPGTTRTINITVTDGAATSNVAVATVNITEINDEPTLTATAVNPTFTEGGAAADLFSGVTADTIEAGQTFVSLTLTVTNVTDGADEILVVDGMNVALTNGNVVATGAGNVTVTLAAGVATVVVGPSTLSEAALQTLIDGLAYLNTSENPTDADRVVTITQLVDSGSDTSPNDATLAPGIASTVNVNPINDTPLNTVPGTQTINEDASVTLSTANGNAIQVADADATTLTVTLTVLHGTLTLASTAGLSFGTGDGTGDPTMTFSGTAAAINAALGSGLTYNPNGDFNGSDSIAVFTTDNGQSGGAAQTDSDSVTVNITAINDAPVVSGDGTESATTIDEDTPGAGQTIQALFAGQYSDAADNQIPNGGASSPGQFSGIAVIANGSSPATGQWQYFSGGVWNNIGPASDSVAVLLGDPFVTLIRFNPAPDFNGPAPTLTVRLIDNSLPFGIVNGMTADASVNGGTTAYSAATVVLSQDVTAVNDAPLNTVPGAQTINEDASVTLSTGNGNAIQVADTDATTLTVTLSVTNGTLTLASTAGLSFGAGDGTADLTMTFSGTAAAINAALGSGLTYNPTANYNGPDSIAVLTTDNGQTGTGGTLQDNDSIAITVNSVNDAPSGANNTLTGSEDDPLVLTAADFGFTDPIDNNAFLAVIIDTFPANGTLFLDTDGPGGAAPTDLSTLGPSVFVSVADINLGRLYFQPDADEFGNNYAQFTFRVQDDGGMANGGVDRDPSANTITFNITPDNLPPAVDLDGATGGVNYTTTFVEDGAGVAIGSGVTVTDPDSGLGDMIESATIILTDRVAGDALTITGALPPGITAVTTPTAGAITIQITGTGTGAQYQALIESILYSTTNQDPTVGGTDLARTITVTVNDGAVDSAAATTTVNITASDDAPVAQPDAFTIDEATVLVGNLFADNGSGADSDPDGPPLSISAVNGGANVGMLITLASGARLTVNANGSFTYDTNHAFDPTPTPTSGASNQPVPDSFTYTLTGGNTVTVNLTINGLDTDDLLLGTAGSDFLFAGVGADTLVGGASSDQMDGGSGIDTALFAGPISSFTDSVIGWIVSSAEGNDVLKNVEIAVEGGGQRHLLVGSTGFAGLQAAFNAAQAGDIVRLASGTYSGTFSYDDEDLTIIAQPNAQINATFTPTGTQGIAVYGSVAADTITTGAGNDLLVGGDGNDTTAGGGGDDSYIVEQAGDIVLEGSGEGYDTVYALTSYELGFGQEVEVLTVYDRDTANAINLTGNNLANVIYGNQGSNLLNGGAGDDTLYGLGGNDAYIVEDSGDVVIEGAGGGFDTVYTFVSHQLLTDQEVETLTVYDRDTTNALDLTGNNLANTIYGNAGTNVIDGKGGNDALYGMAGADTFQFTAAPGAGNVDALADFSAADDTIALDDVAFLGLGSPGALNANAFVIGSSAQDADDRIVYDQATGQLYFDADGNGSGAAVLFATLNPGTILTASDFTVI